jgi:hypothetical protein
MNTFRKLTRTLLPFLAAALFAVSCCSKESQEAAVIPSDAFVVANLNPQTLWEKGNLDHATDMQWVKSALANFKSQSPELAQLTETLLTDPASCGLDLRRDITLFAVTDSASAIHATLSAWIKNHKDFEAFIHKTGLPVTFSDDAANGLTYAVFDKLTVASNGNRVLIVTGLDGKVYAASLFNLDKGKSMASDKYFAQYWKNRSELGCYLSYRGLMSLSRSLGVVTPLDDKLLQGSIALNATFEKGRIDLTTTTYNLHKAVREVADQKFNKRLLKQMPTESLIAATAAFDPEALLDLLSKGDQNLNPDDKIGLGDYTMRDLFHAFGGSLAIDFYGMENGMPLIAIALDVEDDDVVEELLSQCTDLGNGRYSIDLIPGTLSFDDDILFFSTDPAADKRKGGNLGKLEGNAKKGGYAYIDLNPDHYPAELLGLLGPQIGTVLQQSPFDHFESINESTTHNRSTLVLVNDKMNSLAYLLGIADPTTK